MAETNQLHIEVKGKIATLTSQNFQLVGGNSDYEVVFDFDEAWENHNVKTALFVYSSKSVPVVFEGNICNGVAVEKSLLCYIGVFSGDLMTTTPACVDVEQSIRDIGETPRQPTKDEYNQIIELLNKYIEQGGGGGSGESGFSPIVEITPIENGHRVTITDVNGAKSFDVFNGEKGADGHTPVKGVDYFTEADKAEIVDEVKAQIDLSGKADTVYVDEQISAINEQLGIIEEQIDAINEGGVI